MPVKRATLVAIFAVLLTGVCAAQITLAPATFNYGTVIVGSSSAAQNFVFTNGGGTTITLDATTPVTTNKAAFVASFGTCTPSAVIPPAGACTTSAVFAPSSGGAQSATLTVFGTVGSFTGALANSALSGTGLVSTISFSPSSLPFGNIPVGTTSAPLTLTVNNTGATTLTVTSVTSSNSGILSITTNTCSSIAPGGNCTVAATYTPAVTGVQSQTLTFTDSAAGSPQVIQATATGTGGGVTFSPVALNFGFQTEGQPSSTLTSTLTNSTLGTATLAAGTITGANPADFAQTNTCGSSLAANASCVYSVTFTPSLFGRESATLSVVITGVPGTVTATVFLSGAGALANLTLNPTSLAFGSIIIGTSSVAKVINLTNTSAVPLNFSGVCTSGPACNGGNPDFTILSTTCAVGTPLPVNGTCSTYVVFSPTVIGAETGSLVFNDDNTGDGNGQQTAALTGTGSSPTGGLLTFSPNPLDTGHQTTSTTSTGRTVTVTNVGTATVSISVVSVSGDFSETN